MKYVVTESDNMKRSYDIRIYEGDIIEVLRKDGRVHTYMVTKSSSGCRECDGSMIYGGDFADSYTCCSRRCRIDCGHNILKSLDKVVENL